MPLTQQIILNSFEKLITENNESISTEAIEKISFFYVVRIKEIDKYYET